MKIKEEKINELIDQVNNAEASLKNIKSALLDMQYEMFGSKIPKIGENIEYDPDDYLGPEGLCVICISRDCPNCPHQKK